MAARRELPQRVPRRRFALTPLADAMFQLLIFFMLASSLTPFSLITLRSGPAGADAATAAAGDGETPETPPEVIPGETALWTVLQDAVVVGGQQFPFDALPQLAEAMGPDPGAAKVIVILRPAARVQDITSVLEALEIAEIGSVQITTGATSE